MAGAAPRAGRVLIADGDADFLALIGFAARNEGFDVVTASDGLSALEMASTDEFSLLVLDVNVPGANGLSVCEAIRARSSLPVIMLGARADEADVVRALETGADDYLTKPFSPRTLLARMQAVLRRSTVHAPSIVKAGGAVLDVEERTLRSGDRLVRLTTLETSVLAVLMRRPGSTVGAEALAAEAWGDAPAAKRRALKQVVYRLRRKLEARTTCANLLQTTRNAGYRWGDAEPKA